LQQRDNELKDSHGSGGDLAAHRHYGSRHQEVSQWPLCDAPRQILDSGSLPLRESLTRGLCDYRVFVQTHQELFPSI
jgi:hypothetical protein